MVLSFSKGLALLGQGYFSSNVAVSIKSKLRKKLLEKLFDVGPLGLESERTGEIVNTITLGVDKLEDYFTKYLPQIFLSGLIPVMILIFVIPIDWLSVIIFIVTAPIIPLFMYLIGAIAKNMNKAQWKTLSRMSAYFFDVLQGLVTLKLFNKTKETLEKIEKISEIFRIKTMRVLRVAFLSALVLEIASTISIAIIAVSIGLRLLNGDFNFADGLFILIIAPDFYSPLRQLGAGYHAGMEGVSALERIKDFLQQESTVKSPEESKGITFEFNPTETIVFQGITFSYPDRNTKAIEGLSFRLDGGKITAIVGESGAGKTTIMNILLRFINPECGNIKIGERYLENIDIKKWRENISWLHQNPYLFNKSRIGKDGAKTEEVIEAARKSHIDKLIQSLPNRYDTQVGEDGSKFSGGEIQRIALARAYLRNSSIILADEPTANLDPQIEEDITNDMFRLFKEKTVLIIAHKINTIKRADLVIVMKGGKIIDQGGHYELIKRCEYYAKLCEKSL